MIALQTQWAALMLLGVGVRRSALRMMSGSFAVRLEILNLTVSRSCGASR